MRMLPIAEFSWCRYCRRRNAEDSPRRVPSVLAIEYGIDEDGDTTGRGQVRRRRAIAMSRQDRVPPALALGVGLVVLRLMRRRRKRRRMMWIQMVVAAWWMNRVAHILFVACQRGGGSVYGWRAGRHAGC